MMTWKDFGLVIVAILSLPGMALGILMTFGAGMSTVPDNQLGRKGCMVFGFALIALVVAVSELFR